MVRFPLCDVSAVDGETGSGDETCFFGRQVGHQACYLGHVPHSLQRNERLHHFGMSCTHVGGCRPGLDIVDRDSARGEIDGGAANKSGEGGLRHTLDASPREGSADCNIATDKDDPAAGFHFLGRCLDTDKGGTDIDGDHAVKVFETVCVDCAHSENASIADEDVERAKDFCCFGHGGAELFGGRAVGFHSQRFASPGFDFVYKFQGLFFRTREGKCD
jgi:hypothetical protein